MDETVMIVEETALVTKAPGVSDREQRRRTEMNALDLLDQPRVLFNSHPAVQTFDDEGKPQVAHVSATFALSAPKVGRNEKCHCGSGKKFKKCHGA